MTQHTPPEKKEEIKNILKQKESLEEKLKTLTFSVKQEKQPDAEEMKKRQEYLRMQRDKLVALKKEARKQQLEVETKTPVRPKSARAAEKIMEGNSGGEIDPQQLQIRKSLAERLRNKVVNKK